MHDSSVTDIRPAAAADERHQADQFGDMGDVNSETLRRAIAFIHAHAHEEVTATSIARAACVTTRAVQLAFRRYLNTTPSAYLRQVRLDHAHRDLLSASKGEDGTVTQIASRWGFNHQGRFAAYYRQMYGQNPRQTLAR
jgi:transcriptional regulator GlxA family with amidase domain